MFWAHQKLFEIQVSTSTSKVNWNTDTSIHLSIAFCCFHTTWAEVRSWESLQPERAKIFAENTLQKKSADLCSKPLQDATNTCLIPGCWGAKGELARYWFPFAYNLWCTLCAHMHSPTHLWTSFPQAKVTSLGTLEMSHDWCNFELVSKGREPLSHQRLLGGHTPCASKVSHFHLRASVILWLQPRKALPHILRAYYVCAQKCN